MLFNRMTFPLILFSFFVLCACNDEKKDSETPKALGTEVAQQTPAEQPSNVLFKSKARHVVGETDLQKGSSDVWKKLHVNQIVRENDRIRTAIESEAILAIDDGSTLQIDELSDITLTADLVEKVQHRGTEVSVVILRGNVIFDIQKQKGREFKFKTGTATVAIRGTAGFVGNAGGRTVASLKEGRVEVSTENGKVTDIVKKQTIIVDQKGEVKKMDLASSGTKALTAVIDSVIAADTNGISREDLEKALRKFDKGYAARQAAFEKKLKFNALPVATTIYEPSLVLVAQATPGITVTVNGESDVVPENGFYQKTVAWDSLAYGTKRFLAACSDGDVEVPCFMWVTEYAERGAEPAIENADSASQAAAQSAANATAPARNLNLSVKLGSRNERVHLDPPAKEYSTSLKINLAGIAKNDLDQVKSITVRRGNSVVETIGENDLTGLSYEVPITIERNKIADFEVVVALKNGKNVRAKKTYEVYCLLANHPGGSARRSNVPQDQEYEQLVQRGGLTHE